MISILQANHPGKGNHSMATNSIEFFNSIGQQQKSGNPRAMSAAHLSADQFSQIADIPD
jgi:hypothetical protein